MLLLDVYLLVKPFAAFCLTYGAYRLGVSNEREFPGDRPDLEAWKTVERKYVVALTVTMAAVATLAMQIYGLGR